MDRSDRSLKIVSPVAPSVLASSLHSTQPTRLLGLFLDQACILVAVLSGGALAEVQADPGMGTLGRTALLYGLFATAWALLASRFTLYQVPLIRHRKQAIRLMLETWITTWGVGAGLITITSVLSNHLDLWRVLWVGTVALGLCRLVLTLRPFRHNPLAAGADRPRAMFLGACEGAHSLATSPEVSGDKEVLGYVPFAGEDARLMHGLKRLGELEDLDRLLGEQRPDVVIVSPSDDASARDIGTVFRVCDQAGISVQYFPSFLQVDHLQVGMAWNSDRLGLALRTPYNRSLSRAAKRAIDFVGSSVGIVILAPVFLACAVAVKLSSKGPVFYRQTRVGIGGRHFTCYKLRSMRPNSDGDKEKLRAASIQDGPAFKIPNDPRITPAGRFLRKFSLDELPQLFNVWLGDMSLVGPRPPVPSEVEQYTWWQRRRIMVKPGLTCVWQVWGRNRVSFKRWVEMDLYYIDNWSLWMDIKLILHTVRAVFRGTGM